MAGPNLPSMAWRNIWRNTRRTLVTLSGIAFGMMLAIVFTSISDYQYGSMIDTAARLGGGHVSIQHHEQLDMPSLTRTVNDTSAWETKARELPGVERTAVRIQGAAMFATAKNSVGAGFIAFDPRAEDEDTLPMLDDLTEGELFAHDDAQGLIIGVGLASNLGVGLGKKVVYTLTDRSGEIVSGLARVRALVETKSPTIDNNLALLTLSGVRKTLGYADDEGTHVAVFLGDHRESDHVRDALSATAKPSEAALPWHQTQAEMAAYIAVDSAGLKFFEGVILVLVAAGIFNTIFVSVMERVREFGVLLAIGFTPVRLFALVLWESFWIGVVGLVAAALVSIYPYYYLVTTGLDFSEMLGEGGTEVSGVAVKPIVHALLYPESVGVISLLVVTATVLAGLYPAWRASTVATVAAINVN